jgi:hypothetical protein
MTDAERIAQLERQVDRLEAALAQLALRHSGQLGDPNPQPLVDLVLEWGARDSSVAAER